MALFRKFFHRELPEGLLEISERVFVFSCCLTTNHLEGTEYQAYIGRIVDQLREHYPDASFTVHNFGDEHNQTQITNLLSENGITVINYPCQYENCPLLPVETISHFLSSCDDWLYIGQSNVLLMHCQNGAFPILAFMLAALLIYKNRDDGELKSFEMVYKKTPNELLQPLLSVNLLPSQLRYLEYVSKMNVDFRSGPTDSELTLDCVILSGVSDMGCPIFRVYGSEPSTTADQTSKMLFSTPKESKAVRYFKQSDSELVKIDIKYHVHGDVVLECITLHDDDNLEHEELMFRVMFNTAFIRSNMLTLNIEEIDMLCNVTDRFSKDFRAEVLFSEMDPSSALLGIDSPRTNNEGIPTEASDDKSQDKLRDLESEASVTDNAPNTIQQMNIDSDCTTKKIVSSELQVSVQRPAQSKIISPRISQSSSNSNPSQNVSVPLSRYRATSSALGITALLHDHAEISNGYQHYINSKPPPPRPPPPPPPPHPQSNRSFAGTLLPPPSLSLLSPLTLSPTPPPPPPSPSPSLQSDSHSSASILPKTTSAKFPSPVTSFKNQSSVPSPPTLPPPPFRDPPLASPAPPPPPPPFSNVPIVQNQSATTPPPPPPLPAPSSSTACQDSPFIPAKKSTLPGAPCPPPPPQRGCSATISTTICSVTPPKCAGLSKAPPPPAPLSNGISKSGSGAALKGKLQFRTGTRTQPQPKKTPLRPYHWLKLSRAMQGSLWAEAQKPEEVSKYVIVQNLHLQIVRVYEYLYDNCCDQIIQTGNDDVHSCIVLSRVLELDMSELESLFSTTIPNSDHGGKTNRRGSSLKPDKVHLIELRRAYNCEIMLTKVKVPLSDLMTSVLALDDSALDIDQVDNLIKFCPTKEEIELLKNYNGDKENLGKCEQFFLELMKVPRVESKLRVFSFKIQFCSQVSDLKNSLNIVSSASQEVRGSAKLKRIMQTILSLGNALNHGTARGSAVGFRLDSLLKLSETRSRNNKLTLIHYLCKVLAEKLPEVMDFHKDLVSLEAATKIQLKYLAEEMQAISKGLEKAVQELTASQNDGTVSEYFCKTLKEFYGSAEAEVRSLASIYSVVGKNADALAFYFGEDPSRCPFEQVVSTLVNFVKMFQRAHEENCKQLEFEKKKALKEAENGKRERVGKESMIFT